MWEFKFYSRGGQGAVTAAKILINAAILEGKFGQAIPSYGQERKGAPVYTYARIADGPIDVKSYVYRPNCVICFDTGLSDLAIDITEGVRPGATLVVNTSDPGYACPAFANVTKIDADRITHETLGEVPQRRHAGRPGKGNRLRLPGEPDTGHSNENFRKGW